jgi:hypothetical protein
VLFKAVFTASCRMSVFWLWPLAPDHVLMADVAIGVEADMHERGPLTISVENDPSRKSALAGGYPSGTPAMRMPSQMLCVPKTSSALNR